MGYSGFVDSHGHPRGVLIAEVSLFQTFVLIFVSKAVSGNSAMIYQMITQVISNNFNIIKAMFLGF